MINKSKPLVADPAEVPTYGHRYVFLGREWLLDHSYEKYIQIDDNPSPAMRHTRQLLSFHNFATESLHLRLGTYQWIAKRQLISVPFCKGKTTAQEMLQPYYNPISHMPKEGQQVFLFDKLWRGGAGARSG